MRTDVLIQACGNHDLTNCNLFSLMTNFYSWDPQYNSDLCIEFLVESPQFHDKFSNSCSAYFVDHLDSCHSLYALQESIAVTKESL